MKKTIIFLMFLMIPIAYALTSDSDNNETIDFTLKPSTTSVGNNTRIDAIINPTARSDTKGWLFTLVEIIIGIPQGGGYTRTLYYDVLIDVEKEAYSTDENVKAYITIINKGWFPDRDGILISYLNDSDGNRFKEKKEVFELIPPTCPGAKYNWYNDTCVKPNGEIFEPKKTIILREVALPKKPKLGEWKFIVTYETSLQPLISAHDSFEVYSKNYFWMIILFTIWVAYRKRDKTKVVYKWRTKKQLELPKKNLSIE